MKTCSTKIRSGGLETLQNLQSEEYKMIPEKEEEKSLALPELK